MATLAVGVVADGVPEKTTFDVTLASLCTAFDRPPSRVLEPPSVLQHGAQQVRVAASGAPWALYVTDEDDTILALAADGNSVVDLSLPSEVAEQAKTLRPHAVYPVDQHGCATISGDKVDNWQSFIANFDYQGAGGMHAGHHTPSAAVLTSAEPQWLVDAATGRPTVTMNRLPSVYIPLLYIKCQSTAVIGLHRFDRTSWPTSKADRFTAEVAPLDGCTRLYACAAMPAQENCGGFPQRCAELDFLPLLIGRLEREAGGTAASARPSELVAAYGRYGRLSVHSRPPCLGGHLWVSTGPVAFDDDGVPTAVLAYGDGDMIQLAVTSDVNATSLWVHRVCPNPPAAGAVGAGMPGSGAMRHVRRPVNVLALQQEYLQQEARRVKEARDASGTPPTSSAAQLAAISSKGRLGVTTDASWGVPSSGDEATAYASSLSPKSTPPSDTRVGGPGIANAASSGPVAQHRAPPSKRELKRPSRTRLALQLFAEVSGGTLAAVGAVWAAYQLRIYAVGYREAGTKELPADV